MWPNIADNTQMSMTFKTSADKGTRLGTWVITSRIKRLRKEVKIKPKSTIPVLLERLLQVPGPNRFEFLHLDRLGQLEDRADERTYRFLELADVCGGAGESITSMGVYVQWSAGSRRLAWVVVERRGGGEERRGGWSDSIVFPISRLSPSSTTAGTMQVVGASIDGRGPAAGVRYVLSTKALHSLRSSAVSCCFSESRTLILDSSSKNSPSIGTIVPAAIDDTPAILAG